MEKYHINPQTGEVGKCDAKKGKCPFAGEEQHYPTAEKARAAFEESMAGDLWKSTESKSQVLQGQRLPEDVSLVLQDGESASFTSSGGLLIVDERNRREIYVKELKALSSAESEDELRKLPDSEELSEGSVRWVDDFGGQNVYVLHKGRLFKGFSSPF